MSVPHTGRLVAIVEGQRCMFDGNRWISPGLPTAVPELLNQATETAPTTHFDIHQLARHVLRKAGFEGRYTILEWQSDTWGDELPPEAVD